MKTTKIVYPDNLYSVSPKKKGRLGWDDKFLLLLLVMSACPLWFFVLFFIFKILFENKYCIIWRKEKKVRQIEILN